MQIAFQEYKDQFDAYSQAHDLAKSGSVAFMITFDQATWIVADRKPNFRSRDTEVLEVREDGQTFHA
tara:strand:+ start:279 stop:479 length:201 start_codon:yes stop_codon:yes gene_type:complete